MWLFYIPLTRGFTQMKLSSTIDQPGPSRSGRARAARLSWRSRFRKAALASPSLIALRAAAPPDLLRCASASSRTQRPVGNNPVSLPFPANTVYLLALREAVKTALTDKQSYDAPFMSGLDFFFLPPSNSFPLNPPRPPSSPTMSQSVVSRFSLAMGPVDTRIRHSSRRGEWDMLAAITIHEAV